ncbi:MAG: hypothetical protein KGH93_02545 [Patescibacteria group bacterium]|nr:hypothetical protein [Patescibacteria group bacterium]MDE1946054.1 hypothetical protein [Patescibacteria group bacterium]
MITSQNQDVMSVPLANVDRISLKFFLRTGKLIPPGMKKKLQEYSPMKKRTDGVNEMPVGAHEFRIMLKGLHDAHFVLSDVWCDVRQNRGDAMNIVTLKFERGTVPDKDQTEYLLGILQHKPFKEGVLGGIWGDVSCWVNPDRTVCFTMRVRHEGGIARHIIDFRPDAATITPV